MASLFGVSFSALQPAFNVPDEPQHFYRGWGISTGQWIAPTETRIPSAMLDLQVRWGFLCFNPDLRPITKPEVAEVMRSTVNPNDTVAVDQPNSTLYSFVPYLPQAFIFRLLRPVQLPALVEIWIARLSDLSIYVALTFFAMRLLPDFRLHLLCVACLPMAIQQAASLSADSLTLASSFLLAAYMFRVSFSSSIQIVEWPQRFRMIGCVLLASLCKFNIWPIFLFLLIPVNKFRTPRSRWLMLGVLLAVTIVAAGVWNYLNYQNIHFFEVLREKSGQDVKANYNFVYLHPFLLAETIVRTIKTSWHWYLQSFVGNFGWLTLPIPDWTMWEYVTILTAVSVSYAGATRLTLQNRVILITITIFSVVSIFVVLWGFETQQSAMQQVLAERGSVSGVQGRYFIPLALPLMICFSKVRLTTLQSRWLAITAVLIITITNVESLNLIKHYYYC